MKNVDTAKILQKLFIIFHLCLTHKLVNQSVNFLSFLKDLRVHAVFNRLRLKRDVCHEVNETILRDYDIILQADT